MIVLQVVLALILGILGLAAVLVALVAAADFTVRAQYRERSVYGVGRSMAAAD